MSSQLRIADGEHVLTVEAHGPGPVPVVFSIGHQDAVLGPTDVRVSRVELRTLRAFLDAIDE